jgi:hypothetical protein
MEVLAEDGPLAQEHFVRQGVPVIALEHPEGRSTARLNQQLWLRLLELNLSEYSVICTPRFNRFFSLGGSHYTSKHLRNYSRTRSGRQCFCSGWRWCTRKCLAGGFAGLGSGFFSVPVAQGVSTISWRTWRFLIIIENLHILWSPPSSDRMQYFFEELDRILNRRKSEKIHRVFNQKRFVWITWHSNFKWTAEETFL